MKPYIVEKLVGGGWSVWDTRKESCHVLVGEFGILEEAKAEADRLNGNSRHSSPSSSSSIARRR